MGDEKTLSNRLIVKLVTGTVMTYTAGITIKENKVIVDRNGVSQSLKFVGYSSIPLLCYFNNNKNRMYIVNVFGERVSSFRGNLIGIPYKAIIVNTSNEVIHTVEVQTAPVEGYTPITISADGLVMIHAKVSSVKYSTLSL